MNFLAIPVCQATISYSVEIYFKVMTSNDDCKTRLAKSSQWLIVDILSYHVCFFTSVFFLVKSQFFNTGLVPSSHVTERQVATFIHYIMTELYNKDK